MTIIIGGGSAGLYFSKQYKEKHPDEDVVLVEEHLEIGKPVQCTGILTSELEKLLPFKEINKFTLNKITRTKIFSRNNAFETPINSDRIICNVSFIKYLHKEAEKTGVKILSGHKYLENNGTTIKLRNIKTQNIIELKTNFLVGADGPSSLVAKNNKLYSTRKFLTGVQARILLKDLDSKKIDFYPTIGEYSWSAPESPEISRVGVAARSNAKKIFDDFIKKYPGKILEIQGGPIPLHKPRATVVRTQHGTQNTASSEQNCFSVALLGDAALQIKNTTGGGIIPGLKAAKALSDGPFNYKKNLRKLNLELYVHYKLNRILKKYSDREWNGLLETLNTKKTKEILSKINRDSPIKLLTELSLNNPTLVGIGIKALLKSQR
ncbi:hypothetical protein COV13_00265 [Candidatus Woesearchaeota archaeon CG10_big_fil_rev_8_21_14_0_10_32_9]|nr:MAG: hypothetical protein COV13_00265 [Candidatus Woesearchaeota archaeon CG10_big_fil_rev_8_21_14_0_10_32_9]